jgi:hypothetical protein
MLSVSINARSPWKQLRLSFPRSSFARPFGPMASGKFFQLKGKSWTLAGEEVAICVLCVRTHSDTPTLRWELRDVLPALGYDLGKRTLNKRYNELHKHWCNALRGWGVGPVEDHLGRSLASSRAGAPALPDAEDSAWGEYWASTAAVLVFISLCLSNGKFAADRGRCEQMLKLIVGTALPPPVALEMLSADCKPLHVGLCTDHSVNGRCRHIVRAQVEFNRDQHCSPQDALANRLPFLDGRDGCETLKAYAHELLSKVRGIYIERRELKGGG